MYSLLQQTASSIRQQFPLITSLLSAEERNDRHFGMRLNKYRQANCNVIVVRFLSCFTRSRWPETQYLVISYNCTTHSSFRGTNSYFNKNGMIRYLFSIRSFNRQRFWGSPTSICIGCKGYFIVLVKEDSEIQKSYKYSSCSVFSGGFRCRWSCNAQMTTKKLITFDAFGTLFSPKYAMYHALV